MKWRFLMKKILFLVLLLVGANAFAADRLSGQGAQIMFDILRRTGFQVQSLDSGEAFVSAFNLICADDQCMADINFADPAMGRKDIAAKDSADVKKLLLQVGFKPEISHSNNANGVTFLGGANVSCEIISPQGFKQCVFQYADPLFASAVAVDQSMTLFESADSQSNSYEVQPGQPLLVSNGSTKDFAQAKLLSPKGQVLLVGYVTKKSKGHRHMVQPWMDDGTPFPSVGSNPAYGKPFRGEKCRVTTHFAPGVEYLQPHVVCTWY
jgi:hypothetical protein